MSNFLAVATVSATLRRALQAAVDVDVPGSNVRTARPDGAGNAIPGRGVNIFLYQVTPNAALRNADLPTRNADGDLVQRPRAAIDLHYLLAFYGDDNQLEPQRLLGTVVRTLHTRPILTRQMIQDTLTDPLFAFLANSNLADSVELVKFTPLPLSLEDLSKLWSVFFQVPYALSVAYMATVVLLDSDETPPPTLPVRERKLYAVPLQQPVVSQVASDKGAGQPITLASKLVIKGQHLRGDVTQVRIAGALVTPPDVGDAQISFPLSSVPAGTLRAGVQGVQVVQSMLMGEPPVPHRGVESNVAACVLQPVVKKLPNGNYDITLSNVQGAGNAPRSADVAVKVDPIVGKAQQVTFEMLQSGMVGHTFAGLPLNADSDQLNFKIVGVQAGDYTVRVRVDGAESLLDQDANGQYIAPKVTIP